MRLIDQKWWFIQPPPERTNEMIETIGRTCYKSQENITPYSADKFVRNLIKRGHESVIEHINITLGFKTDRGVLAELTRHRLAAFSVESTRYINYKDTHIEFIRPVWVEPAALGEWSWKDPNGERIKTLDQATQFFLTACIESEASYNDLIYQNWRPEQARQALNMSLATEIVMSANAREWRHVLKLRTSNAAHPQMNALMRPVLSAFKVSMRTLFADIEWDKSQPEAEI